jgi:hypothetical protein
MFAHRVIVFWLRAFAKEPQTLTWGRVAPIFASNRDIDMLFFSKTEIFRFFL